MQMSVKEIFDWHRSYSALREGITIPAGASVQEIDEGLFVDPTFFPPGSIERHDAIYYGCPVNIDNIVKPRYTHDCSACVFLGHRGNYDLYYCPNEPTIVCRFSSKGPDYNSGLTFAVTAIHPPFKYCEALYRALQFSAFKKQICEYFEKFERGIDLRWRRFKEILKIAEVPVKNLPLLMNQIKHVRPFYEFKLKRINNG